MGSAQPARSWACAWASREGRPFPWSGPTPSTSSCCVPRSTERSSIVSTRCMNATANRRAASACAATWRFTPGAGRSRQVNAGDTLRILDEDRFELVWSLDGWKSTHHTASRALGSAGFSADVAIPATAQSGELSWTIQWTEKGRWLGYNVQVKIGSESTPPGQPGTSGKD